MSFLLLAEDDGKLLLSGQDDGGALLLEDVLLRSILGPQDVARTPIQAFAVDHAESVAKEEHAASVIISISDVTIIELAMLVDDGRTSITHAGIVGYQEGTTSYIILGSKPIREVSEDSANDVTHETVEAVEE